MFATFKGATLPEWRATPAILVRHTMSSSSPSVKASQFDSVHAPYLVSLVSAAVTTVAEVLSAAATALMLAALALMLTVVAAW